MKDRIRQVRKSLGLTQIDFGNVIGVKGNTVTGYESGLRNPTDAVIKSICREFLVNEEWLRNGTGEMFIQKSKDEEIAEFMADVQLEGEDSFKHRIISGMAHLSPQGWDELEKFIDSIQKKG